MAILPKIKKILTTGDYSYTGVNSNIEKCILLLAAEFDKLELENEAINLQNAPKAFWDETQDSRGRIAFAIGVKFKDWFGMTNGPFDTMSEALDTVASDGEFLLRVGGGEPPKILKVWSFGRWEEPR